MAFRITLLALFGLSSLPIPAQAVLNAAKASALDKNPNFAGCPAIGSGGSSASSSLCKGFETPKKYCSYYVSNSSLAASPEVKDAYKACTDYYQAAIDALQLVCDYERDSNGVLGYGSGAAGRVSGAASAQGAAASTLACGKKVFFYYSDVLNDQIPKLNLMHLKVSATLTMLAEKSGDVMKSEVHCEKDGTPGYAPGYLLAGLATAGLNDHKQTRQNVDNVLGNFGKILSDNISQAKLYTGRIAQRQSGLGAVTGSDPLKESGQADAETGAGDAKAKPEEDAPAGKLPAKLLKKVALGTAKDTVQDGTLSAVAGGDFIHFRDLIAAGEAQLLRDAAHDNLAGLLISIAVHVAQENTLRTSTAINELAGFGIGVVGCVLGAPPLGIAVASEVVMFVGEKIAEHWNDYDKSVMRAFQQFAQANKNQLPNATSQQVAQSYAAQKKQLAYCSKCSAADAKRGCPGYFGAAHGYNPNYLVPDAGDKNDPFTNAWIRQAYEQAHARAGNGPIHFDGIPEIPPTAVAPSK